MTGSRKMPWDGVANKKHPKHRHNMMICVPTSLLPLGDFLKRKDILKLKVIK